MLSTVRILDELQKLATSFYKICGTYVLSIRAAPRLVNSLLFLKLIFVYYSLFYFGVYNR
ncbi:recombination protein F [Rickettsia rickettsii str. 'Sheila Smith']|uniref:Recombination protein F n=1 Tax=Rickettsia rickettsii (strain Sheila Smith) TaxID=392021 RepID=A0A0H3AXV5_RICRS|nr:recombination protein F [Rickettsia rickettsii str. 'Sheila Smith']